jgi:hypothetical protein
VTHYKKRLLLTVSIIPVIGKIACLVTVFLFSFCVLHAQEKSARMFAEISIGPSFPIGQFAEKEYPGISEKDQPGMAGGVGMSANVTFGYYLKENVGLLLTGGYSANKQKPEGYSEYFKRNYYVSATEVDVNTNSWKIIKIMAGGFLVTPLTEGKLNLITKLSAGICKTAIPKYSWLAYSSTGPAFAGGSQGEVKLPATFCYQISLGLQYKLNEHFHLLFDINSFNATATREMPGQTGTPLSPVTPIPDHKYKLGTVNALIGVGLNF